MAGERWTFEDLVGIGVRLFCGGLLGAFVGFSWVFWLSPMEEGAADWSVFAAVVIVCAVLAAWRGDEFWQSLKHWL